MADLWVYPSQLHGNLKIPSSKSHTLRAILFAALAKGDSQITDYLPSPDTTAMIEAVRLLGAKVEINPKQLSITGFNGKPQIAQDVIQCGNSGQVLRFISALAGLIPAFTLLTGDHSIRYKRPMSSLLSAMNQLGAFATSSKGDDYAPILVRGPFLNQKTTLDGEDSQPVSGLLIAAAFSSQPIEIHVTNPGETPWISVTLDWFKRLGINYHMENFQYYALKGSSQIQGFEYQVPGDFSSAAFGMIAALITQSEITLENVDINDIQGDKAIVPILKEMGAQFLIDEIKQTITLKKSGYLKGTEIDINPLIDALPILAVLGCFATTPMRIFNGQIARRKESDRISSIAIELKKMGAKVEEKQDGLIIYPSKIHGTELHTYQDHRLALSLAVAALAASSPSKVSGIDCASKTYKTFTQDFQSIGAQLCI